MKITKQLYYQFFNDYFQTNKFEGQRFGQAFVNTFLIGAHPELFYETDDAKSFDIIDKNHIDW